MLSENIKKIRKSKGLTQKDLALQLNVVRQTVSKWEQGVSKGGKAPFWHTTLLAKCSVLYALSTADRAYMNTPPFFVLRSDLWTKCPEVWPHSRKNSGTAGNRQG